MLTLPFIFFALIFASWGCAPSVKWKIQTMDQKKLITKQKPFYQNGKYQIIDQNGNVQWIDEDQIKLIDKVKTEVR